jgi:uncharacterized DUF497 family protein
MILRVEGFIWADWVLEKLVEKHGVDTEEVEQAFFNPPYKVRRSESGKYLLYGRSESGRYLFIVLVWDGHLVKVISQPAIWNQRNAATAHRSEACYAQASRVCQRAGRGRVLGYP